MDPMIKKRALRLFTYGLYIVTCVDNQETNAFTANWLSQVSFEPPMLTVSVEHDSKSLPMILHSQKFAVNVLRSGQRELAGALGRSAYKAPDKLQGVNLTQEPDGFVVLRDALAWIGCEVRQSVPSGDSTLIVAEIVNAAVLADGQPLTMAEAGFRHAG